MSPKSASIFFFVTLVFIAISSGLLTYKALHQIILDNSKTQEPAQYTKGQLEGVSLMCDIVDKQNMKKPEICNILTEK